VASTQESALRLGRNLADLIEEDRPFFSKFEAAQSPLPGRGKTAFSCPNSSEPI
jgi:hypothetical protein